MMVVCLFDLPDPGSCNFTQWRILAQKNLVNPRFKALFPHASALEKTGQIRHYHKGKPNFVRDSETKEQRQERDNQLNAKKSALLNAIRQFQAMYRLLISDFTEQQFQEHEQGLQASGKHIGQLLRELIDLGQGAVLFSPKERTEEQEYLALLQQKKAELADLNKKYKELYTKPVVDFNEEQLQERQADLSQLGKKRGKCRREYAELCQGTGFDKVDMLLLESLYETWQHNAEPGHKILVEHGITTQSITQFNKLARANNDKSIPNIMLDGEAWSFIFVNWIL